MALTAKQNLFVQEYLIDLNATQAANRAGYSARRAAEIGYQLLQKTTVQEAIQAAMEKRAERTEITADRVLREYAKIAFFDPRRLYRDDGQPVPIADLDDETAGAIAGLEVLEEFDGAGEDRTQIGFTKKYKIADKVRALDSVARHLGMFVDRVEHSGKVTQEHTHDLRKLSGKELADLESIIAKASSPSESG